MENYQIHSEEEEDDEYSTTMPTIGIPSIGGLNISNAPSSKVPTYLQGLPPLLASSSDNGLPIKTGRKSEPIKGLAGLAGLGAMTKPKSSLPRETLPKTSVKASAESVSVDLLSKNMDMMVQTIVQLANSIKEISLENNNFVKDITKENSTVLKTFTDSFSSRPQDLNLDKVYDITTKKMEEAGPLIFDRDATEDTATINDKVYKVYRSFEEFVKR